MRVRRFSLMAMVTAAAWVRGEPAAAIIYDTDMGPDYDDVGALAVLHALADAGEAKLLGTVSCNRNATSVPCIEVINAYYGRWYLPVGCVHNDGVDKDAWHKNKWTTYLASTYPHRYAVSMDAPDAVAVYRRLLSAAPDASVTVVTVGFLTNLKNLLRSPPDAISPLDGKTLVKGKVKRLVSMAGKFPQGREWNIHMDAKASQVVFSEWPTPIVFSGWEIGSQILTGKRLIALPTKNSPVKDAFALAMKEGDFNGRMSWDETAALVAVKGSEPYFGEERGRIAVADDGSNTWQPDPAGPHSRLLPKMAWGELSTVIEDLMMHLPQR